MDKNAIKKYAVWARRELISRVTQKALQYGITENDIVPAEAGNVNGIVLTSSEKAQRQALIGQIQQKEFDQVMEEVAYTWFNRFSALRFMEVNGYLPSHIRVFTDDNNAFKPQILTEAIHLELDGLDMEKVYALKESNDNEALFKYLIIVQCNALSAILPGMFQKIDDYTELLFPDNLLREGSAIEQMVAMIPEEDWQDQVQIIGWLYQYYNTEPKDKVFADLKKNIKVSRANIPAATQLFTPDWIVRYMVENSLGRLWLDGHPNDELKASWRYYLEEAEQEPAVQAQLAEIRKEYAALKPEDIRCIDPCSGSGHICAYLFDVLVQIYEAYGYTAREAASSIVEHNLYGLDIDERAAQLAYFSVMMKARQYDRRFFSRGVQPHVYAIRESNHLDKQAVEYFCNGDPALESAMETLTEEMYDAKEYGSILTAAVVDYASLYARFDEVFNDISMYREYVLNELLPFVRVAEALAQKYHAVVTNPPYMGAGNMNSKLTEYVKKFFPDSRSDLSTCFMEKCAQFCGKNGYYAMINIPVWMFLSSYEKLRRKLVTQTTICNMVHPGRGIFGSDFGTTAFVVSKRLVGHYSGTYRRLFVKQGEVQSIDDRERAFFAGEGVFIAQQEDFSKIPGSPVAYWVPKSITKIFETEQMLSTLAESTYGLKTGDNDKFIRYWYEIAFCDMYLERKTNLAPCKTTYKWFPCNMGGNFRKWYGNFEKVVDWENDGERLRRFPKAGVTKTDVFFKTAISWTDISSSFFGVRFVPSGSIGGNTSPSIYPLNDVFYLCGLMTSKVTSFFLQFLSPTIHNNVGDVTKIPVIQHTSHKPIIEQSVNQNITLSHDDWDSFETSWDFQEHPLCTAARWAARNGEYITVQQAYEDWAGVAKGRFQQLKANEEELNRIFIDIYGLQDELTPEVEDKDVTVRRADLQRDIKSLISYAVGCMFGRYSLSTPGLAYAGGEWEPSKYHTFLPDKDAILPICDDEYFDDDILGRFVDFIREVFGPDTLEENLKYIADALGGKGQPRDVIRSYFLNGFYADHCKTYQKRPIYWLFDSGKKNGFKCLVYMHRYQPDTIARIRTDYVHEQQSRYRTAIADLEQRIAGASTSERVKLNKQLVKLQDQATELHEYEEIIHHLADQFIPIDLDDGVKINYAKFQAVLAKIK